MNEAYDWLFHEHSGTEELLRECVEDAKMHSWEDCMMNFQLLVKKLKSHMAMEDEILFPAYAKLKELPQRPIQALTEEHNRVEKLLTDIHNDMQPPQEEELKSHFEELASLLHTHHEKEENFFLPLAGLFLLPYKASLEIELENFDPENIKRKWKI